MIRTLAITNNLELKCDVPLEKLNSNDIAWYWVDFSSPTEDEGNFLSCHFRFHSLAIEDCFHFLQRPKLDYYDGYNFFVLHALNPNKLQSEELDMFLAKNFIVTFHLTQLLGVETVWERVINCENFWNKGPSYITYELMDKIVDEYFPILYRIEDKLNEIEINEEKKSMRLLMVEVFDLRGDLLKLRRTILPMRELLYRVLNSEKLEITQDQKAYFSDIYDHLLKLTEMVDSNRDMTSDIRDNYLSLNSNRMNKIMATLTIVTSIFIPLTFIVGIYGMNFENMPELKWQCGYFMVLGFMAIVGGGMALWFKRKGWFDIYKE